MRNPTLFDRESKPKHIISSGGEAVYYGVIFDEETADRIYEKLLRLTPWKNDMWVIYGKEYVTSRKIAWYAKHHAWIPELVELKEKVETITGIKYRNVLLNLYESGTVGLGWHNDKESLEEDSSIASVSLGAERRFDFRHIQTKETVSVVLEHGSLLVMQGLLQHFWKHQLPKSKNTHSPRINLTFRR